MADLLLPALMVLRLAQREERREESAFGEEEEQGGEFFCRVCRRFVTAEAEVLTVMGSVRHTFFNPAGLAFTIGCFRRAPGALPEGEATLEHTWFQEWGWQVALCAGCGQHLGWRYQRGEDAFFGLILDRLARKD